MDIEIAMVEPALSDTHLFVSHHNTERLTGGRVAKADVISALELIPTHGRFAAIDQPDWMNFAEQLKPCMGTAGRQSGAILTLVCNPKQQYDLTSALQLTVPPDWYCEHPSGEKEHLNAVVRCMVVSGRPIADIADVVLVHPAFYPSMCLSVSRRIARRRDVLKGGVSVEDIAQRIWLGARGWFQRTTKWGYKPDTDFTRFLAGVVVKFSGLDVVKDLSRKTKSERAAVEGHARDVRDASAEKSDDPAVLAEQNEESRLAPPDLSARDRQSIARGCRATIERNIKVYAANPLMVRLLRSYLNRLDVGANP